MWKVHLVNLLGSAKAKALNIGGTTLVGVVVAGALAIIVGFLLTSIIEWHRGGRTVSSLKAALKSWPPYVGAIGGLFVVWIGIYLWAIAAVTYQDHQAFVATVHRLGIENKDLRNVKPCIAQQVQATPVESPNSLRKRTMRLVNDLEVWSNKRYASYPQPVGGDDATLQKRKTEFEIDLNHEYTAMFKERTIEIVKQFDAKGLDVGQMLAEYGISVRPPVYTEIQLLKNLAYRVDSNDKVVHF